MCSKHHQIGNETAELNTEDGDVFSECDSRFNINSNWNTGGKTKIGSNIKHTKVAHNMSITGKKNHDMPCI